MKNISFDELIKIANQIDDDLFGTRPKSVLLTRLNDEVQELIDASDEATDNPIPENKLNEIKEFGDVLFCLVACSRQYGWGLEEALSLTITKLQERKKFNVYGLKDKVKENGE